MPAFITRRRTVRRQLLLAFAALAASAVACLPGFAAAAQGVPAAPAVLEQDGTFTPTALRTGTDAAPVVQPAVDRDPSPGPITAPVGDGWG